MYPALAVVDALAGQDSVTWIGGRGGMEQALVERAGIAFRTIPAAGVHGVGLGRLPGNIVSLVRGYAQARGLVRELRPDAVLFTGGYVGVPVALASRDVRRVAFVPDIQPGLALRWIGRRADAICVSTERSLRYYSEGQRVRVTGYPSRFAGRVPTRDEGRRGLGLAPDGPVLLVMGGSRGARSINQALWTALPQLLDTCQVVHLTGSLDWPRVDEVKRGLAGSPHAYWPFDYLHDRMAFALAAADLVVSRAGASVLGDFPHFGLPAILVPYPHAWEYQSENARFLEEQGAAVLVRDEELGARLVEVVARLLRDRDRSAEMAEASRSLARPQAAAAIAGELRRVAGERSGT